jgi:hypothetical protein
MSTAERTPSGADRRRKQALGCPARGSLGPCRGGPVERRVRRGVEQLAPDRDVCGAVGNTVVHAHDDRAAAVHTVNDMHIPQRSRAIQRCAGKVADQFHQRRLAAGCG